MSTCQVFKPSPPLSDFVQLYYLFQGGKSADAKRPQRITPDGCVEISFNLGRLPQRKESDGENFTLPVSYLVNRVSRHYFVDQLHDATMVGIRFHPWGFRAFRNSSPAEVPTITSLEDFFGSKIAQLEDLITNAPSASSALERIDNYLQKNLRDAASDRVVSDAVRVIRASRGTTSVEGLSVRYGLTSRRLQQRFKEQIGVGPRYFSRLVRFQLSLKEIEASAGTLTDVAHSCGYSDQSHFIRDFIEFTGVTPTAYLREDHSLNDMIISNVFP